MILAFSTSSPWASVALLTPSGGVRWAEREHAPRAASTACLTLLQRALSETGIELAQVRLFGADLGPGSFTGVRVGVVMAKTLAWTVGGRCFGADSFDLVDPERVVALPSKKAEFFVRVPGEEPVRAGEAPPHAVGYGFGAQEIPPEAYRFGPLIDRMEVVAPEQLLPRYLIEASISQPKKPLSRLTP